MIGSFAWQFVAEQDTTMPDSSRGSIRIREMQQDEILSFELFGIDDFPTHSGLPGPEYPHLELSERDWDRSEKMAADFDEAYRLGTLDQVAATWVAENGVPGMAVDHDIASQAQN
jgi:hypothetical protein